MKLSMLSVFGLLFALPCILATSFATDLPTKRYLNLAAIKTMVAAAEAEARKLNVDVTICIVDESGNLLFLHKGDTAPLNTIEFAQKKARHAALYKSPSKDGADALKKGNMDVLAFPDFFPNQGGLPILADGQILGGISASGAPSGRGGCAKVRGIRRGFATLRARRRAGRPVTTAAGPANRRAAASVSRARRGARRTRGGPRRVRASAGPCSPRPKGTRSACRRSSGRPSAPAQTGTAGTVAAWFRNRTFREYDNGPCR